VGGRLSALAIIAATLAGAVAGGLLGMRYRPDDATSWGTLGVVVGGLAGVVLGAVAFAG
jgi:hypothetical protein